MRLVGGLLFSIVWMWVGAFATTMVPPLFTVWWGVPAIVTWMILFYAGVIAIALIELKKE